MSDAHEPVSPSTTAFSVEGARNGSPVLVTWSGGVLSGDPPTVDLIEMEAELVALAASDPFAVRSGVAEVGRSVRGLADPEEALRIIRAVIDRITAVTVAP